MSQTQVKQEQKFHKGDLVQIAGDLGPSMSHFTSGCRAIVVGSYADQYGGSNIDSYTLWLEGLGGRSSWYREWQITLIEKDRNDLLETWDQEAKDDEAKRSDLDWIFNEWKDVSVEDCMKGFDGIVAQALYTAIGGGSLWGSRGEGITFFTNQMKMFEVAVPFLIAGDKEGFLAGVPESKSEETP